jgi:hypothetical protein
MSLYNKGLKIYIENFELVKNNQTLFLFEFSFSYKYFFTSGL